MTEKEKKDKKERTLTLKSGVISGPGQGARGRSSSRVSRVVVESKRGKISKTRKPKTPNIKTRTSLTKSKSIQDEVFSNDTFKKDANNLTDKERLAREKALADAANRKEEEDLIKSKSMDAAEKKKTGKEKKQMSEAEVDIEKKSEFDRGQKKKTFSSKKTESDTPSTTKKKDSKKEDTTTTTKFRKDGQKRRSGKLTMSQALNEEERQRSLASIRRRQEKAKKKLVQSDIPKEKVVRNVTIPEVISVQELSNRMAERGVDVIKSLMQQGVMVKINDTLDSDTAQLIAEEFGHNVTRVSESDVEVGLSSEDDNDENKTIRPPVVTVMGHVDHGKTSLLDAIRETNNVSGEAGGITQHIGAYQVEVKGGNKITFIDTPGHAAFTAMRARGAKVTDIVILVVAADDSVMPQTVEAINHAKEANVPIIVAINKVDKKESNPTKTKNDLIEHEILVEELGGEIQCVELSAETKAGIPDLIDSIILQAEILDLKANAEIPAEGFVIESKLDKGRGPLVTVLIQKGKLKKGDILVVGENWGKVRSLINDKGSEVKDCQPGEPIEVLGLNDTPKAGDTLQVVESEARAREISDYRLRQNKKSTPQIPQANLEQMLSKIKGDIKKEIPVIVKTDVHGSSEAIREGLLKLGNEEVSCRVIHSGVGEISQSDVTLAEASEAMILGFNVRANVKAKGLAEKSNILIVYHSIIYNLLDEIKKLLEGKLDPDLKENIIANAEVLEVFKVSKVGNIAGCKVLDGTVKKDSHGRLIRDGIVIYEGLIEELKRFKDDAKEVVSGQECGIAFDNNQDIKSGDKIECFEVIEIRKTI
ncbi:uncharacterized protein METZ01_LOCUS2495 [marine metagenome]|uniref:Tr-type G domain-containing protein n=1 Tax=marine metagenome TaxID=408172 RepID=A0A381N4V8_9ZZZZ|tara:strand:- start:5824 stop:8280 length:2457 start_codon:yes stop_codon:yes gene_type:complete